MPSEWDLLQQVFTAQTIMTPWSNVATIAEQELKDNSPALRVAADRHYSYLPVMAGDRVTGIFEFRGRRVYRLEPNWPISRDTPIPELHNEPDLRTPALPNTGNSPRELKNMNQYDTSGIH